VQLEYEDLTDAVAAPGAHRLLEVLRRLRIAWAVVTSADTRLVRLRLNAAGISPTTLVTVEDVAPGKPAPDGYVRAAELLAVPPQHCLSLKTQYPASNPDTPQECRSRPVVDSPATCRYAT
jgi:sugar-phosphatase